MRYNIAGPVVESGVTAERIKLYGTTPDRCRCPANNYGDGNCKHMQAIQIGCGCPETVWFVEPEKGRLYLCAEVRCEYWSHCQAGAGQ